MPTPGRPRRENLAILWISILALYLELLLIRWVGTEVRIFAYLQNTVLVVCFLGLGVGLFTCRQPIRLTRGLLSLTALAAGLAYAPTRSVLLGISEKLSSIGEINIWEFGNAGTPVELLGGLVVGLALTGVIMILIFEPFVPIGRLLGRLMDDHARPIVAYSLNVAGSLLGIWIFVLLSMWSLPPEIWFLVLLAMAAPIIINRGSQRVLTGICLAAVTLLVALEQRGKGAEEVVWSPYQKLALLDAESALVGMKLPFAYFLEVNNIGYQVLIDLDAADNHRTRRDPNPMALGTHYDVPALLHPRPQEVLLVGAGAGNDAAATLRRGAGQITAVEIDPAILRMGRRYHPQQPYSSPRVREVLDDARSFFATTEQKYDLISFGLLDSHTSTALTNARLDHYVYTLESITRARDLLNDGGIMTLMFHPLRPFIIDRMATVLRDVFGAEPLAIQVPLGEYGPGGILFVAGDLETAGARIDSLDELATVREWMRTGPVTPPYMTPPVTDDWPYMYLARPTIPLLFPLLAGMLLVLLAYARGTLKLPGEMNPRRWQRSSWHFFFLGAAFLLLEVQNISKASVVLGSTWVVNAVIISGVLGMVLLANLLVLRWPAIRLDLVFAGLLATVLGLYFIDLASFAFLPFATKALLVGALTTLPMLFSGIIFVKAFALTDGKDVALGANLIGSLVGAVLQSVSFLIGIKALLLIVAAFYVLAMVTKPVEKLVRAGAAQPAPGTA